MVYSAAQLKTMQKVITLGVFAVFSVTYLGETLRWNHGVAFRFYAARPISRSTNGNRYCGGHGLSLKSFTA
jgi:hypothetical protein